VLEVGWDLIRHARTAALSWAKSLQTPDEDVPTPPVVRGVVHTELPAGCSDVPQLPGQSKES
jgi:hypothetical protein